MLQKMSMLAACLILACGSDALAASRPVMMASPKPDAAMVLSMPGMVNGATETTIGGTEKMIWEGLVLRETRIKPSAGTIVIPPAGAYMTVRSGNWRPFDNEPISIAGKRFYYINQRSARDVLHDVVMTPGQIVPMNGNKSRGWYLKAIGDDPFFQEGAYSAVFQIVKSTGNYYGEAFPVKVGPSYTENANSGKFGKGFFEKEGRTPIVDDAKLDSFIIGHSMSPDGRSYVIVDEITPTQVKVREMASDSCTDAWISPNKPLIASYSKGDTFTIGNATVSVSAVSNDSVSISIAEDGKTVTKTFGPWNDTTRKALYVSERNRDQFWTLSPSGKEIVHLNVRNPEGPLDKGKASLVAYSDVIDVQDGSVWPFDTRFRVRPET